MTTDQRKLPPQSLEAEMSVLGGVFLDNGAMETVQGILHAEDFYLESHRQIYLAMLALDGRNEPIDLTTMSGLLKNQGCLEQVGGGAYLATLWDYVPHSANISHYCKIVSEKSVDRRVLKGAQDAAAIIYGGGNRADAISLLEQVVQPVIISRSSQPVGMSESVMEATKRLERRYDSKGEVQGIPYGIEDLDGATSGMHPGQLIIVAGRPSMGKSSFARNVLANNAKKGHTGLLFTLEMSRDDNVDCLMSGEKIRYQAIRSGQLSPEEWTRLTMAMSKMHNWPVLIDDTPGITLHELRSKCLRQKKQGLDFVVIDYLQLMSPSNSRDSRVQALGEISRGLKQLARELEVPVMALSQLNRSVDSRQDKRPTMSDLRDSGEIEQDADVILFPYRPAAYCQECKDRVDSSSHNYREHQSKAEIIIEKQRAGERNISIPACWLGHYQRFVGIPKGGDR